MFYGLTKTQSGHLRSEVRFPFTSDANRCGRFPRYRVTSNLNGACFHMRRFQGKEHGGKSLLGAFA